MNIELKPCPFCGEETKLKEIVGRYAVECSKHCGCVRKDTASETGKKYKFPADSISETLCWDCVCAANECPWMRNFTPVKGWKATRYDYIVSYNKKMKNVKRTGKFYCVVDSYIVEECPLFLERKKREEKFPS